MPLQVWLKFEKQKKDGTTMKLRIQDLPEDRIEEAVELMVKYYVRDEPIRRAIGFVNNPEALEEYRFYIDKTFRSSDNVMCCPDTDDDNPVMMGVSIAATASATYWDMTAGKGSPETTKINALYFDCNQGYDLLKEFNITSYYCDKSILVAPEYRGNGLAEKFLTVRRLMCAAKGLPLTGAWMNSFATQIVGERDGWTTVREVSYDSIATKHGLVFENNPPTMKLMVARPHPDYSALIRA